MKIEDRRQFNDDGTPKSPAEREQEKGSAGETRALLIHCGKLALGALALGVFFFLVSQECRSSKSASRQAPEAPRALDEVDAVVYCHIVVKQRLKAPKTAEFSRSRFDHVQKSRSGRFLYRSYVDSENAFGAMLRTRFLCEVEDDGQGKPRLVRFAFE
ncbi:MAG: hypothetical protein ACOC7L_03495 [Acidobacteriota bacterium]